MEAKKLRIGNYIYQDFGGFKPKKLIQVNWQELKWIQGGADCYKPIPLTEQVLVDCFGFKSNGIDKRTFCESFVKNGFKLIQSNSGNFYRGKQFIGSVDKLQNVYYFTKDEELEYKPKK